MHSLEYKLSIAQPLFIHNPFVRAGPAFDVFVVVGVVVVVVVEMVVVG